MTLFFASIPASLLTIFLHFVPKVSYWQWMRKKTPVQTVDYNNKGIRVSIENEEEHFFDADLFQEYFVGLGVVAVMMNANRMVVLQKPDKFENYMRLTGKKVHDVGIKRIIKSLLKLLSIGLLLTIFGALLVVFSIPA
jgi:hypothetical protein